MLRDKNLIPLSHQHQRALALCVRIDRATPIHSRNLETWQTEMEELFEQEMDIHFVAEELEVFPAARQFAELNPLVDELISDHGALRELFAKAVSRQLSTELLQAFAQQLSAHIRQEERQLFERMQQVMTAEELSLLGTKLEAALANTTRSCRLTNQVTKLRPAP